MVAFIIAKSDLEFQDIWKGNLVFIYLNNLYAAFFSTERDSRQHTKFNKTTVLKSLTNTKKH